MQKHSNAIARNINVQICRRPGGAVGAITRCGLNCGDEEMGSGVPMTLFCEQIAPRCPAEKPPHRCLPCSNPAAPPTAPGSRMSYAGGEVREGDSSE